PERPVSVSFVWNAHYGGIHFPRKRTTVLEVKAPRRSLYWRAAVLDSFADDRWVESPPLHADALMPGKTTLLRQQVRILALAETRLVGASVPVRYDAGDAPIVSHVPGLAQLPSGLTRGFRYTAWSEAPAPTAAELARSRPVYPIELTEPGTFLDVQGATMAPFGRARRAGPERYAPLRRAALAVAGDAQTPYAAAAAGRPLGGDSIRLRGSTDARQAAHRHGEEEGSGVRTIDSLSGEQPQGRSPGGSLLALLAMLLGAAVAAVAGTKLARRRVRY